LTDLVLLHGGLYNAACWDPVVDRLRGADRPSFDTIVQLDIPGAGTKRHRRLEDVSCDDIAAELCDEVGRAGVSDAVLIGHSIAGTLMPLMCRHFSFDALCFVSTAILAPGQIGNDLFGDRRFGDRPDQVGYPADPATTSLRDMDRLRFCLDFTPEQSEHWLDHCYEDAPNMAIMTTPAPGIDPSTLPPVTYVRTLRSPVFPLEWQDRFASRIGPDVTVVDIDTGHAPFFTHPAELAHLITALYGA
jgi:pimeloyl-ACP methyl ester carboxylesterase